MALGTAMRPNSIGIDCPSCGERVEVRPAFTALQEKAIDELAGGNHLTVRSTANAVPMSEDHLYRLTNEVGFSIAVVNPNQPGCDYPDALCGTGVAYRLCEALGRAAGVPSDEIHVHLDLVALATVADLVPLTGDNRTLVRIGLRAIEQTEKPGLRALMERAEVAGRRLDAGDVGYRLAPRINAAGRMDDAMAALRLLLTDDEAEAGSLATVLDSANRQRREEERRTRIRRNIEILMNLFHNLLIIR